MGRFMESTEQARDDTTADRDADPVVTDDRGFVLLDVLIGIAVLALLLLTVLTSIGAHAQRSWQGSATADARQLGQRIEAQLSDFATLAAAGLPASANTLTSTHLEALETNLTRDIHVARYVPVSATEFTVCLVHYSSVGVVDAHALFDSTSGRVTTSGRGTGPAACAPVGGPPTTPTTPTAPPELSNGIRCPVVQWVSYVQGNPNSMVMAQMAAPEPTVYRFDFPTPGATNTSSIMLLGSGSGWAGMFFPAATGINLNVTGVATGHDGRTRSDCVVSYARGPI